MNGFEREKEEYDSIPVPKQLHSMVMRTIAQEKKRRAARLRARIMKMSGSVAALLVLSLMVGVNTSYAFAKTATKVPVVRSVAKALTVRNYEKEMAEDEELLQELEIASLEQIEAAEVIEEPMMTALLEEEQEPLTEEPDTAVITGDEDDPEIGQGLESWVKNLTVEALSNVTELYTPEMEEDYAQQPKKLQTILLSQIAESQVYLYGYHEDGAVRGVALRVGDKFQCYNWTYFNETKTLPAMTYQDLNKDGSRDILIILYNAPDGGAQMQMVDDTISENDADDTLSDEEIEKTEGEGETSKDSATEHTDKDADAKDTPDGKTAEKSKGTDTATNKVAEETSAEASDASAEKTSTKEKAADTAESSEKTAKNAAKKDGVEDGAEAIASETDEAANTDGDMTDVSGNEPGITSYFSENWNRMGIGEVWIVDISQDDWFVRLFDLKN